MHILVYALHNLQNTYAKFFFCVKQHILKLADLKAAQGEYSQFLKKKHKFHPKYFFIPYITKKMNTYFNIGSTEVKHFSQSFF